MVGAGAPRVLVLYPEPRSSAQARWTAIRDALAAARVRVPDLEEDAPDAGAALIEDLGDRDLAVEIRAASGEEARARLLDEAEELLAAIRTLPRPVASLNPPFDAAFFRAELGQTRRWALEAAGEAPLPAERAARWDSLADALATAAANRAITGDPVPTHRDYHANNLMRAPDGRLAPIDFQDLRLGPPDYDAASLRFERAGASVDADPGTLAEAVVLQRAWKVLGTFEKMLRLGREIYRPHRDATRRILRERTSPGGTWAPLLEFLD